MKNLTLLLLCLLIAIQVTAQYNSTIRTGRPGQAIGAFTVGKNSLQFQQGVDFYGSRIKDTKTKGILSNNVVRFGIQERIEFSALIDYQMDKIKSNASTTNLNGISNLHLGFRINLSNQERWKPATAFQLRLKMPDVSTDYGINHLAPTMTFVAQWNLPKNTSLTTNWILDYNGNDAIPTRKYVLNFAFPIYEQWSGFIENYGQINQSIFQTRFDAGIAYLATDDTQLDISAGYGSNSGNDYFISAGISWRIHHFRKQL